MGESAQDRFSRNQIILELDSEQNVMSESLSKIVLIASFLDNHKLVYGVNKKCRIYQYIQLFCVIGVDLPSVGLF